VALARQLLSHLHSRRLGTAERVPFVEHIACHLHSGAHHYDVEFVLFHSIISFEIVLFLMFSKYRTKL
jgi:hypothetical protein